MFPKKDTDVEIIIGWNSLYLENHDQPRSISRFGTQEPRYRGACAKMLVTFLLSLRGTPFLYQGQELGLPHPENWSIEDYKDVETQKYYKAYVKITPMSMYF